MSGSLEIPVYYDFASSLCYVAHRVMERMAGELDELGIALRWTPIDLTRSERERDWRERVWRAVYEDGQALDRGWVHELARELVVDPERAVGPLGLEALATETALAAEAEVTGVPTFLLDGFPIGGIHEERTMRSLLGRYAARMRSVH